MPDMYTQTVLVAIVICTPDRRTKGIVGNDVSPVLCQFPQQRQLGSSQCQCFALRQGNNGIIQVYAPLPQLQRCRFCTGQLCPVRPLQNMLHPQQQFLHQKRLGQVVICAKTQPKQTVGIRIPCGEEQRRDIRFCPQRPEQRKPVPIRQVDIQDHQLRLFRRKAGAGSSAALGSSDMAISCAPQLLTQQCQQLGVVIHNENLCIINGIHKGSSPFPPLLYHTFCAAAENACKFKGNLSCASGQFKAAGVFWHRSENHECERRPFMKPVIETHALCKSYHGRPVVDHLNLAVPEGCVYGFLGPNGAGKSTTMKMLLGLVHPTGGSVELLGHTLNEANRIALLRQTGSLIESPSGYLHLTARENLSIVADLKDVDRKDISRVLEIVHLTKDADRKVGQYSLGMKQRLGIAMALLGSPKLLILDEPTNGLDPAGIQEMRSLIASMPQTTGATVLISSHLLGEIEQMVDQVGILNHGRLLFEGSLQQLQKHSRGGILLRVLDAPKAAAVLQQQGVKATAPADQPDTLQLPPLPDEALAALVCTLAESGVGVVGLTAQTKSLEDIFLSLTQTSGEVA
mgnify:CR=1 FL=1